MLDIVERKIERLRSKPAPFFSPQHDELQRLYLKRERLQAQQFRALQKKIAGMKK